MFLWMQQFTTKLLENGEDVCTLQVILRQCGLEIHLHRLCIILPFHQRIFADQTYDCKLIQRQMRYITIDPYANAFIREENVHCWEKDITGV